MIVKATFENVKELLIKYYDRHKSNEFLASNFTLDSLEKDIIYLTNKGLGYVCIENEVPVGYILGYKIQNLFFNNAGIYTPDFAVYYEDETVLYQLLKVYYEEMKLQGFTHHAMTLLSPHQDDFIVQMGYGLRVMDGVRFPRKSVVNDSSVSIKVVDNSDFDSLLPIFVEHNQYMSSSPIFLDTDEPSEELYEILKDENKIIFKIQYHLETVGFSIVDKKFPAGGKYFKDDYTLAVKGTHIKTEFQNKHIGSRYIALLDNYCLDNSYHRLAVDYESANFLAANFWRKHYQICAKSYVKYLG